VLILAVTAFFGYEALNVKVCTIFSDLLPMTHPYIKTHMEYVNQLGDPLKIFLMVRVRNGDIYNINTLSKITRITQDIDLIPAINHNQVISIASSRLRRVLTTEEEIRSQNLMPMIPTNDEEIRIIRDSVRKTEGILGIYVSPDEKSTLLAANFFGDTIDYTTVFDKVMEIVRKERDDNHEIFVSGEPILNGWIYKYKTETYFILMLSMALMVLPLFFYFRNLPGVVVPALSAGLCAIWGLGFVGLIGYNLDPLALVIVLLVSARAMSHSVQMVERYFEEYQTIGEVKEAIIKTMCANIPPGMLGIATDCVGILLIAVAPIPMLQKMAISVAFWAGSNIVNTMIIAPIMLSFCTPPKNISAVLDWEKGWTQKIITLMTKAVEGRRAYFTFAIIVGVAVYSAYYGFQVRIGDINPGTPILWPKSEYNRAVDALNKNYTGIEELYIIVEGKYPNTIKRPEVLKEINKFQRFMEQDPKVAATLSIADLVPPFLRALSLGQPKWEILPDTPGLTGQLMYYLTAGSHPGDYDRYMSREFKSGNIIIWYKDHKVDTIEGALARAKSFIDKEGNAVEGIQYRLASGSIGILAAVNESVESSQLLNFVLIMIVFFGMYVINFRSIWVPLLLAIPINMSNLITLAIMSHLGIGLNINTLPIVSLAIGVGDDYGLYIFSRIAEEYDKSKSYSLAFNNALRTSGKAVFFTATTMAFATGFWYFISNLRFQAEMGLLLTVVMFSNMVLAMIVIPTLVYVFRFKPKFINRG
jgi:predicted RND superfamily exporter protein